MSESSGPESQVTAEPEPDTEAAQLEGIERDLDTVDAALSALDSDDLAAAEALAAELEAPQAP